MNLKTVLALVLVCFRSLAFSQSPTASDLYDISGTDENGTEINLKNFRGSFVLLNFTATSCGPCWSTYAQLNEIQKRFDGKLKVISFHHDDQIEEWNEIAKKRNLEFSCTSIWLAKNKEEIFAKYQIDFFPSYLLFDRKGTIIKRWRGNKKEKLVRILEKSLR